MYSIVYKDTVAEALRESKKVSFIESNKLFVISNDEDFLNSLTNMVAQSGMSAAEAQAYLASMGIDAEVTEDTTNSVENGEIGGAIPSISWEPHTFDLPIIGEKTFKIPKIDWDPTTEGIQTRKQVKAHGIKVTSAKKSTGGAVKHKQSSHGGGNAGKKGKSGGGGGSKGGSTKKNSGKTKKVTDEKERYHEIKNALEDLDTYSFLTSKKIIIIKNIILIFFIPTTLYYNILYTTCQMNFYQL